MLCNLSRSKHCVNLTWRRLSVRINHQRFLLQSVFPYVNHILGRYMYKNSPVFTLSVSFTLQARQEVFLSISYLIRTSA